MKKVLLLLVALLCTGCAFTPAWLEQPTYELSIRWHRMEGDAFLDKEGVCNIYMVNTVSGVRVDVEKQLNVCLRAQTKKGFARQTDTADVKNVRFYYVSTQLQAEQRFVDYHGMRAYKAQVVGHNNICGPDQCMVINAFNMYLSRYTGIVYTDQKKPTLGHELKHVWDGNFHNAYAPDVWVRVSPR